MTVDEIELLVTAYHEAGHAVVAVLQSHGLRYATIRPRHTKGQEDGTPNAIGRTVYRSKARIRIKHVVGCLAGDAAERRAGIDLGVLVDPDHAVAGTLNDMEQAAAYCFTLVDGVRLQEMMDSCQDEAQSLIQDNWPAIKAVAQRLYDVKTLSGAQVRAIMADF